MYQVLLFKFRRHLCKRSMASRVSVVVLFSRERGAIVIKEFYSGRKQKPQNFQHHKNGRQKIAACNAQWAIPDLK